jgi:hypothetical protein
MSNSPPGNEGRRSADRRNRPVAASCGCGSALCEARSPFGAPPRLSFRRPNATTQLRAALHSLADRYLGPYGEPWTLSAAKLSQTPGRPVVMPAGTMPEAAREQFAKPPAGAAPAPHSGLPSGKRPIRERGDGWCNRNSDNCQWCGDNIFRPGFAPLQGGFEQHGCVSGCCDDHARKCWLETVAPRRAADAPPRAAQRRRAVHDQDACEQVR